MAMSRSCSLGEEREVQGRQHTFDGVVHMTPQHSLVSLIAPSLLLRLRLLSPFPILKNDDFIITEFAVVKSDPAAAATDDADDDVSPMSLTV